MKFIINNSTNTDVTISDLNPILYHDIDGNIILTIIDKDKLLYFFLTIDNKDNLEWVRIEDYNRLPLVDSSHKLHYNNIQNSNAKYSLRGKIIDKLEEEDEDKEIYSDEDIDADEYKVKYKYYPEDKLYFTSTISDDTIHHDTESESDDDYTYNINNNDTCKFKYSKDISIKNDVLTCLDRTLNFPANYDTFIFDENSKMILITLESSEKNHYRIIITHNHIELNIIGTMKKIFTSSYLIIDSEIHIISSVITSKIII